MCNRCCTWLISMSYAIGFLCPIIHIGLLLRLTFCRSNILHHFYCEILLLYTTSYLDPSIHALVLFTFVAFISLHFYDHQGLLHPCPLCHPVQGSLKGTGAKLSPRAVSTCSQSPSSMAFSSSCMCVLGLAQINIRIKCIHSSTQL